jgi:peptidoglycan/xylan/chitin deacetylase (PgdA/CDA1 family)
MLPKPMNGSRWRHSCSGILIAWRTSATRPKVMHKGFRHLLGLCSMPVAALLRPGPVVRWLSRRFPDVLFQQPNAGPLIALTFDDSPHATSTPRILDVLAAHDARATFFMIGEYVAGNEEIVRRLIAEGHEVGNHMLSDAASARLPAAEFERQLLQTHEMLAAFGPVRWFRPGHTWFNRRMLDQIHCHGYRCAMASTYAYEFLPISAPYAAQHILLTIRPGGVIILHDGPADQERTVAVLELLLPALHRRGYRVVTLSELAAAGQMPGVDHAMSRTK